MTMSDLKKTIEALENYEPYAKHLRAITVESSVLLEALELLKEQELEFEPYYDPATGTYNCGYCGCYFDRWAYDYCPKCGKKMKWDG